MTAGAMGEESSDDGDNNLQEVMSDVEAAPRGLKHKRKIRVAVGADGVLVEFGSCLQVELARVDLMTR